MNEVLLQTMLQELQDLKGMLQPGAQTRPLSALELIKRWAVPGETESMKLDNLAKRCRQWGLQPMKGTRGASATYLLTHVQAAEAYAGGDMKRRRSAA